MATPAYMSITGTKQGLITAGAFTEDSVGNTYCGSRGMITSWLKPWTITWSSWPS